MDKLANQGLEPRSTLKKSTQIEWISSSSVAIFQISRASSTAFRKIDRILYSNQMVARSRGIEYPATRRLQMANSDRIEKKVILRAPVSVVWKAITNTADFSNWFGISLDGEFTVGRAITGTFDKELNEAAIIEHQKRLGLKPSQIRKLEKYFVFCTVQRIQPERLFSFRWVPYGIDAEVDPKNEPTTLVEFHLKEVPGGTELTIIESGFDRVPAHRRERAFRMNEGGWATQAENIKGYVEKK